MGRGYQLNFSERGSEPFDVVVRRRKAATMVSVLEDYLTESLISLSVLNVGGSAGIIDEYLGRFFESVVGIDIDEGAIRHAFESYKLPNIAFTVGDALKLPFADGVFDVVVCSQVYEHVPDADIMMAEIWRILRPGGVVYFAAGNRLMINEPHYNLPLLSVLPRALAHVYLRCAGKGSFYYEKHLSLWGLKRLVSDFSVKDYTRLILDDPKRFGAEYMMPCGSFKQRVAVFISKYLYPLVPGYIWVLKKL